MYPLTRLHMMHNRWARGPRNGRELDKAMFTGHLHNMLDHHEIGREVLDTSKIVTTRFNNQVSVKGS